jgi:hypothetical protein
MADRKPRATVLIKTFSRKTKVSRISRCTVAVQGRSNTHLIGAAQ